MQHKRDACKPMALHQPPGVTRWPQGTSPLWEMILLALLFAGTECTVSLATPKPRCKARGVWTWTGHLLNRILFLSSNPGQRSIEP